MNSGTAGEVDTLILGRFYLNEKSWRLQQLTSPLNNRVLLDLSNVLGERSRAYTVTSLWELILPTQINEEAECFLVSKSGNQLKIYAVSVIL